MVALQLHRFPHLKVASVSVPPHRNLSLDIVCCLPYTSRPKAYSKPSKKSNKFLKQKINKITIIIPFSICQKLADSKAVLAFYSAKIKKHVNSGTTHPC
jgi:hypothetical protein